MKYGASSEARKHLLRFVLYCAGGKTQGNCDCKDGYFWQQFLVTSSLQTKRYFRRSFLSFLGREKRLLEIRLLSQAKSPCTFFCMHPDPYSRRTVPLIKQYGKPLKEVLFIVFGFFNTSMWNHSGALARLARGSGAPWLRKCSNLPIRENFAITWSYTDRPTVRLHHRHTNAKFRVVCGEGFLAR